jgi:hypothetical protein
VYATRLRNSGTLPMFWKPENSAICARCSLGKP